MENFGSKFYRKLRVELRKNLKKINYFACDNGLGHIKRSVAISNKLGKYYKIILHTDLKKLKKFKLGNKISKKKFKFNTRINSIDANFIKKIKKLNLKKKDLIISDNYTEFCLLETPLIIYANFFWHEIFKINNKKTKHILNQLIKKKIPIFGNYIFQFIKKKGLNLKKIGFIGNFEGNLKKYRNILVSLGTAEINTQIKKKMIFQISEELKKNKDINYYFDKMYFYKFKKFKNVFCADYTKKMYKKISVCIGKPGMGTINDCFRYGIILVSLDLPFNQEFKNNSHIITQKKLGISVESFQSAVIKTKNFFNNKKLFYKYFKIFKNLRWNGELDILDFIKNNY